MFWHVPKSGGTTVKSLYEYMGQTLANRVGGMEQFGHHEDAEIVVFQPFPQSDLQTVNVDVTSKEGILRAGEMGLATSGKADLIVTSKPHFASMHLFDEEHIGRVLAMFRHPVDRAVSKFYYLQTATWERTYRPEWAEISLEQWAGMKKGNNDQNYLVRELNGKNFSDKVDENDLEVAKEMLRQRFTVGLMTKMEESIRRFNVVLGLDGRVDKRVRYCMHQTFGTKEEVAPGAEAPGAEVKQNSNKHPKVIGLSIVHCGCDCDYYYTIMPLSCVHRLKETVHCFPISRWSREVRPTKSSPSETTWTSNSTTTPSSSSWPNARSSKNSWSGPTSR